MIRISPVRLIDESNNQVGIIELPEAQSMARTAGLDLVEVSPTAEPPVCRIMDYGKWLYQQKRKDRSSHKKQHAVIMKEVRLRPEIGQHDKDIKVNHALKFLEKGHRVQFTVFFRGREMRHVDHGYKLMETIVEDLAKVAKVERPSRIAGKRMTLLMVPKQ